MPVQFLRTLFLQRLRPLHFFVGILVGFGCCCLSGRWASRQPLFEHFHRFHYYISEDTGFFPTVSEVCRLVESQCPPEKTLVIVGGSSILQGYGQSEESLWSSELQRLLGDDYVVINLAMRSGYPTDFAWITAQILSPKYPKMIYLAECPVGGVGGLRGSRFYAYYFWDAYYKNLFPERSRTAPGWKKIVQSGNEDPRRENRIEGFLDGFFYFNDLWNFVGYRKFFTALSKNPDYFTGLGARKFFADNVPHGEHSIKSQVNPQQSLEIARKNAELLLEKNSNGEWKERPGLLKLITEDWKTAFDTGFTGRIMMVEISMNPYVLQQLTEEERRRNDWVEQAAVGACRSAGLETWEAGQNFGPDDYYDLLHLNESGGRKLAQDVAARIRTPQNQ